MFDFELTDLFLMPNSQKAISSGEKKENKRIINIIHFYLHQ